LIARAAEFLKCDAVVAVPSSSGEPNTVGRIAEAMGSNVRLVALYARSTRHESQGERLTLEAEAKRVRVETTGRKPRRILLVDDIATSGGTLKVTSEILRRALPRVHVERFAVGHKAGRMDHLASLEVDVEPEQAGARQQKPMTELEEDLMRATLDVKRETVREKRRRNDLEESRMLLASSVEEGAVLIAAHVRGRLEKLKRSLPRRLKLRKDQARIVARAVEEIACQADEFGRVVELLRAETFTPDPDQDMGFESEMEDGVHEEDGGDA
jgi:hypoxanthine phosphoribosyltransferase